MYGEKAFEHGAIVRRGFREWEVLGAGRASEGLGERGGVKPVSSRLIAARRFHNNFNTPGGNPRISGAYFYKRFWFPEEAGCHPRVHAFNLDAAATVTAAEYTRGMLFYFSFDIYSHVFGLFTLFV